MSHNVENMFSVKETPWHGLGSVIQSAPTISEGISLAGLAWDVLTRPVYQQVKDEDGNTSYYSLGEWAQEFYRSTDGRTLGIVGPRTYPLQNREAFDFFQPFVEAGECSLETAGSLCSGQKVWVMAKIQRPNAEIVPGDSVAKFVLLSNSHDGTTAVRVGFTPIRVVCANTLAMAHGDKASKLIRVRHSKDVKKNVEKIRETMNLADEEFEATAEQYRALANHNINSADLRKYLKIVFKMEEDESKIATRSKNILSELEGLFETGHGNDNPAVRGTWWAAYNGVTQYLSYNRGNSADTRINSLWFGDSARVNELALKTALELATPA